jgi:cation transport ATPase
MHAHLAALLAAAPSPTPSETPDTQGLANWLQGIFGPLFLAIIGIVSLFFLFTREITRFIQFLVLSIAVAVIFYWPGVLVSVARGAATALGIDTNGG